MREPGVTSTGVVPGYCSSNCARPTGVIMVAPPEVPRNAERAQCAGRVALVVEEEQRGQQHTHYKGRDTPKDTPARSGLLRCGHRAVTPSMTVCRISSLPLM